MIAIHKSMDERNDTKSADSVESSRNTNQVLMFSVDRSLSTLSSLPHFAFSPSCRASPDSTAKSFIIQLELFGKGLTEGEVGADGGGAGEYAPTPRDFRFVGC